MNLHHLSVSSDATWQRYAAPINTQCTLSHGEENVQCSNSYKYIVRVTVSVDVGDFEIEIPGCLFCRPDRNKSDNGLLMYTMDYNCALSCPDSLKLLYISSSLSVSDSFQNILSALVLPPVSHVLHCYMFSTRHLYTVMYLDFCKLRTNSIWKMQLSATQT